MARAGADAIRYVSHAREHGGGPHLPGRRAMVYQGFGALRLAGDGRLDVQVRPATGGCRTGRPRGTGGPAVRLPRPGQRKPQRAGPGLRGASSCATSGARGLCAGRARDARAYLDLPLYGGGIVARRGRTEIALRSGDTLTGVLQAACAAGRACRSRRRPALTIWLGTSWPTRSWRRRAASSNTARSTPVS